MRPNLIHRVVANNLTRFLNRNLISVGLILLTFLFSAAVGVNAQWVGGDGQVLNSKHKNISLIGVNVSTPSVTGGPSAKTMIYGDGWDTPPVYAATQEKIDALKLNENQKEALKVQFPDFIPWTLFDYGNIVKYYPFSKHQLPYALSLDFTGRGEAVSVIAGHDADWNYVVVLEPWKNGYRVHKWRIGSPDSVLNHNPAMLMLIRNGSGFKFSADCEYDVGRLQNSAFVGYVLDVSTSTAPPESLPQFEMVQAFGYYNENFFAISSGAISQLSPEAPGQFNESYLKDMTLTSEMRKALAGYDENFKVWEMSDYPSGALAGYHYSGVSLPYAVKVDFNKDGRPDMLLAGHDNDSNLLLELISGTSGYYVTKVGSGEPCYSSARERGETLEPRPSQIISLYSKGRDFLAISTNAASEYWRYNDDFLIGTRMLNSCMKPQRSSAPQEEEGTRIDDNCPKYTGWQTHIPPQNEVFSFYGEKSTYYDLYCNLADACSFVLLPPGHGLK